MAKGEAMRFRNQCCKDCQDRHLGCHDECERYAEANAELEREKAERDKHKVYNHYAADNARRLQSKYAKGKK